MTAQIHENLIFNGEHTSMSFCPPIPKRDPRIVAVRRDEAYREDESKILSSTACWRGYQGTWEIRDGRFFLAALRGKFRLRDDGLIWADWFSGVLRIPRGKVLQYVHMGFGSVYEEEIHVKVEKGVVTASRVVDNRGKPFDRSELSLQNLPGDENRFPGDGEM
jgi:hypothetical protein